ncbi:MAG TPA: glutathionylspermidine synthase family protein [Oculatellaceae cyanobacterium]
MEFHPLIPRKNWRDEWKRLGYSVELLNKYWIEDADQPFCVSFKRAEIEDVLIPATRELNEMVLKLVDDICNCSHSDQLLDRMRVPIFFREAVRKSWQRRDDSIYGRFDFAYNGHSIKLLEINFDSPIMILETAVLQKRWCDEAKDQALIPEGVTQFNRVGENLIDAFQKYCKSTEKIHFSSFYSAEDEQAALYIQSKAKSAGFDVVFGHADRFGIDESGGLIDAADTRVTQLFKLYPWTVLQEEDETIKKNVGKFVFTEMVESGRVRFFEPAWKFLASSKATLALLWEMAPKNKFLLETHIADGTNASELLKDKAHVKKPIFGRGGESVSIVFPDQPQQSELVAGDYYGAEGFVVQEYTPLPIYMGHYVVVGSWVVNGKPSGVGIRADRSRITGDGALFVPHYVID